MQLFSPTEVESLQMFELLADVTENVDECEIVLVMLEHDHHNMKLYATLLQSINNVRSKMHIACMEPMIPLIVAIENVLALQEQGEFNFNSLVSDLALTTLELVQNFVDDCAHHECAKYDSDLLARVVNLLSEIKGSNQAKHQQLITQALLELDPTLGIDIKSPSTATIEPLKSETTTSLQLELNNQSQMTADLEFFKDIMTPIEKRINNWAGRSARQTMLAASLNQAAGLPVDAQQLTAAVLLHDIGMPLMPLKLLDKQSKLNDQEIEHLRSHINAAMAFVQDMHHWDEAMGFITDHHERFDGSGYPRGAKGTEISEGAKILAIVDSFEAMTHERSQVTHYKRPLVHAAKEIELNSGTQFCPFWVNIFKDVFKTLLRRKRHITESTI
ncbi:MAG: HD domain-containing protein [Pseudomonadales bacterium]|nr:HD domain-containing protein [Pseudomonadales bacterium]